MPNSPTLGTSAEDTRIILTIQKPAGGVDAYNIECTSTVPCNPGVLDTPQPGDQASITVTYDGLTPHKDYVFNVKAVKNTASGATKESVVATKSATTEEARKSFW